MSKFGRQPSLWERLKLFPTLFVMNYHTFRDEHHKDRLVIFLLAIQFSIK